MRRYLSVLLLLVTLVITGCAGDQAAKEMRTPGGGAIGNRLPEFSAVNNDQATGQAPLPTITNGKASVTPYYTSGAPQPFAPAAAELPPVKIGILVPLSGPQANLGQAMLNAAQLALFDIGASNITIVPRDTTIGAARAATEALGEGAQIILGPLFAQDVKAVTPIASARNVPVIAFSTDWTAVADNTYIMGFLPFGQVARVVDFAARRGARNFGALIPETPYGAAVNGTLKNTLERQNLGAPRSFIFGASNNLPQAVQAVGNSHVDALLLPLNGPQLSETANLLRQNNIDMSRTHLIGTGLWDDSPQAAALIPGSWYAAPDPKLRASFNDKYRDTYGAAPPRLATLAYDATALSSALALKGLKEKGSPAYARSDFTNPSGFAGLDGVFRFRPDGLAERGLAVLELRSGGPVVVDAAPSRF